MLPILTVFLSLFPPFPRICYFWLPLWGVTCSLLYLSRTHSKRQDVKHRDFNAVDSGDSGYCNPLINSTDQGANPYYFEPAASSYAGSLPGTGSNRQSRRIETSFDSADPASAPGGGVGYLRESRSSTQFGGSDAGMSGHTEQLFGVTDSEHDHQMFGAVYSPDNSIGHNYRDSSLFSPAVSVATPKEFRLPPHT